MLHLHQTRIRINSLILKPGCGHCWGRSLPNPPRVWQPRVQGQRRAHAHHIHLGRQHPLRGGAPGDPTGHHDRHGSNLSDLLCEREEVRLPIQGSLILGDPLHALHSGAFVGATRHLYKIHAQVTQHADYCCGVVNIKTAALKIRRIQLYRHRGTIRHGRPDSGNDLPKQAAAVLQVAAPPVGSPIHQRGQELRQQIAVRRMHLHPIKPALNRPGCGGHKHADDFFNLFFRHGDWGSKNFRMSTHVHGDCRRRELNARQAGRHLATRVVNLHPHLRVGRAIRVGGRGPLLEWFQ